MSAAGAAPSSNLTGVAVVLGILVLILARRTVRMVRGTAYSWTRLVFFAGLYVLLFTVFGALTIVAAIGSWGTYGGGLLVPYAGIVVVSATVAAPYVQRIVRFERRTDGRWYYRLPWVVPALTLGLFVTRFVAEIVVFGFAATTVSTHPTALAPGVLLVLVGIDLLFGISVGLLIGRAIGVRRAFRQLPSLSEAPSTPPLPSG